MTLRNYGERNEVRWGLICGEIRLDVGLGLGEDGKRGREDRRLLLGLSGNSGMERDK